MNDAKDCRGLTLTNNCAAGMSLALDRWPVATWFGLRATYFWILLARTSHLSSKLNVLKNIKNQFFCVKMYTDYIKYWKILIKQIIYLNKKQFFLKFHLKKW